MKIIYFILPVFSISLFAQTDSLTSPATDPTQNRLFLMSTGFIQPKEIISIQIHELLAYQMVYSPTDYMQFNLCYGIPRQAAIGSKVQLINNDGFIRSLSVNIDAVLFMHNHKKNSFYLIPNINGTLGSRSVQFSYSLTPLEMERYKYDPPQLGPYDWLYEGDGYNKVGMVYKIPAVVQTGLMFHAERHHLKFILETHFIYEGKRDRFVQKISSLGIRKYWSGFYFDLAVTAFQTFETGHYSEQYILPYLGFGFIL